VVVIGLGGYMVDFTRVGHCVNDATLIPMFAGRAVCFAIHSKV
jgi:hypothetical protein